MTDYKCSSFSSLEKVLCSELFSSLKWHSCPFISPWLHRLTCTPDVFDVRRITQGSLRRCRSLTPSLSRKRQALSSADFSNKNNNGELYLQGYNQHSIQIICLVHAAEQNLKHGHFCNGPQSKSMETSDLRAFTYCFAFWTLNNKKKSRSSTLREQFLSKDTMFSVNWF